MTVVASEFPRPRVLPSSIAVTGAGGFIGGRIAQMLHDEPGVLDVRAFSRRGDRKAVVQLDDSVALREGLSGCGAMLHCAFDMYDIGSNLRIARTIGLACARAKIRLVQMSTAAIYEPLPADGLDEHSHIYRTDPYRAAKIDIEEELLCLAREEGLEVVVLQPTIVYGPGGRAWTDSPVRDLLLGSVILPNNGEGCCNAVFVDDVCRAAIGAITASVPSGERFLISGPTAVSWGEFLGAYDDMIGGNGVTLQTGAGDAGGSDRPSPPRAASAGREILGYLKNKIIGGLSAKNRSNLNLAYRRLRMIMPAKPAHDLNGDKLALYTSNCRVQIDKARRLLDYEPEFDLQRGMAMTRDYVQRAYARDIRRHGRKKK